MLLLFVAWLLSGLAIAGTAYAALAALLVWRPRPGACVAEDNLPSVSLLKPLAGSHPGLEDDLRSFCEQQYPGQLQIIFGVQSRSDAAIAVARRLAQEYPSRRIELVVDPLANGANPKVANLRNMLPWANGDVIIVSDSDIRVGTDYVVTLVGELAPTPNGAVTCLYAGRAEGGLWSQIAAMNIDLQFLPNALLAARLNLAEACFGATIALRRETLDAIGGFAPLSPYLADDFELGRAVCARGGRVRLSSLIVQHSSSAAGLEDLFRHELRWARTVRVLNPLGYAGTFVTHALPLAILAAVAGGFSPFGLLVVAAALAGRVCLAWRIHGLIGARVDRVWLLPLRDVLAFVIFLVSFLGNSVYWQGTRYRTTAHGVMAQQ